MSQTSIERLRDYLAQLPPQSLALLMREFERAVEKGEDTKVANLVLEQLRKILRQAEEDDDARPRTDDPARLLFRPLEPFLAESNFPVRPGQIRRASLLSVWQWLSRDGVPVQAREFEQALARAHEGPAIAAATRKFQLAAADAIGRVAAPAPAEDRQRALTRVGPPNVAEDLPHIGAVLRAREALETLGSRLPARLRGFGDSEIAPVTEALNVPSLQAPQLLPFSLSLVMPRPALADHSPCDQDGVIRRRDPRCCDPLRRRRHHRAARSLLSCRDPADRYPPRPFRRHRRADQGAA
jgi:hypothetical protein